VANSSVLRSPAVDDARDRQVPGSFRDPAGFVFTRDGAVYRQVNVASRTAYDQLMQCGLYDDLTKAGLLIPHSEVPLAARSDPRAYRIIKPERIAFVSYPYEWCFGQLKDAALATLDIQRAAMARGMSLKDASAYNIQFRGSQPVLIDTLSFEPLEDGRPWVAYRQFCQHFLAPLALMSTVDPRLGLIARAHIDGAPLDLASRLLPIRTWLGGRLLLHVHLHALACRRFSGGTVKTRARRMTRAALLGLLDNLRAAIDRLSWSPDRSTWAAYDGETNYSTNARKHKEDLVHQWLSGIGPSTVWDLGCNAGRFSRIAAAIGAYTVAFDADYGAAELTYRACRTLRETHILPLVVDLANPSPAIGWAHAERSSWADRGPVDAVMALALVHHLVIGNNVPLSKVAQLLARIGNHLVIEFVPKSDSQVQRLLASRADVFEDYTRAGFESAFADHFHTVRCAPIQESERVLYLMRRR